MAAAPEHPVRFGKRLLDARARFEFQTQSYRRRSYCRRKANPRHLPRQNRGSRRTSAWRRAGALLQHVGIDIEHDDLGERRTGPRHPEGDIAGAAGDVEMAKPHGLGRPDPRSENVLPNPMETARHQIVHEIVARSDLVKNLDRPAPACRAAARGKNRNAFLQP